ncbi:MAG: cardiolipin synthase [Clostridia bacterium]
MEVLVVIFFVLLLTQSFATSMAWFITTILVLQFLAIIAVVFVERKQPATTLSWVLVLMYLPVIGYIFYIFFGSTKKIKLESKKKRMKKIDDVYSKYVVKQLKIISEGELKLHEDVLKDYIHLIELNTSSSHSCYIEGNDVKLFTSGKDKFDCLFKDIENAKETINVLYFIIKGKDEIGKKFIKLLSKKAKEGVRINLIYDRFGDLKTSRKDFKELIDAGGKVIAHLPNIYKSLIQGNYRNHRKIVVIDGKVAYTGGINIGDEYLGLDKKLFPWRDTSIKVTGNAVVLLQLRFLIDWIYLEKQLNHYTPVEWSKKTFSMYFKIHPKEKANMGIQIVSSGPDSNEPHVKDAYMQMINSCKKFVYIQSPYFIPDIAVLNCISIAARCGKDVRVMLPGLPDKKFVWYITSSYIEDLLSCGVKVYLHKGFIHAKTMTIDEAVSSVGTTNLDERSFRLNYEVNTIVYDTKFGKKCKKVFEEDMKDCMELKLSAYKKRKLWIKICESACRFFAPLS